MSLLASWSTSRRSHRGAGGIALPKSCRGTLLTKSPGTTYTKSQIAPLKNNYNGATPDPGYIPEWQLTLDGLASGLSVSLNIRNLFTRFQVHEQITRLVCVEGWSAIAWWADLRFDDLLHTYPPMSQAQWVRVESSVNLDPWGNPDPYFVSLDIPTARHSQTLLATHFNGQPLTVDHGAPLRLLVPLCGGWIRSEKLTSASVVFDIVAAQ